ncbi:alpha/beta fold hydrolase [Hirschia litorea]|uniref:Alpha/beta fold hydrolase n=1 Tax=Hirschia litorea TaxID=1199156 RepID=A0ABW2IP81_9PROT
MTKLIDKKLSRRSLMLGASAAYILTISGCINTSTIEVDTHRNVPPQTFVLVHGAWHGGWCWREVKQLLERDGHTVLTPTLSGLGNRASELTQDIDLETHISNVVDAIIAAKLKNFVLVGHSYGGMVITGVADRLQKQITHIVYLDAAVPTDGQSMLTAGPTKSHDVLDATKNALLSLSDDNGLSMRVFPAHALGIPTDHTSYNWVVENLTPNPMRPWFSTIRLENGGAKDIPKTYVHCVAPVLEQTSFPYFAKVAQSDSHWNYLEIQTGHEAMITAPEEVHKILIETLLINRPQT